MNRVILTRETALGSIVTRSLRALDLQTPLPVPHACEKIVVVMA